MHHSSKNLSPVGPYKTFQVAFVPDSSISLFVPKNVWIFENTGKVGRISFDVGDRNGLAGMTKYCIPAIALVNYGVYSSNVSYYSDQPTPTYRISVYLAEVR